MFIDPSRDDSEERVILVADLESSGFLVQLESFVDAVHRFKASCKADDPTQMSDADLRKKAAAASAKPKSSTTVGVVYARNRYVAGTGKAQSRRQMRVVQTTGTLHQCVGRTLPGVPPHRLALSRGSPTVQRTRSRSVRTVTEKYTL